MKPQKMIRSIFFGLFFTGVALVSYSQRFLAEYDSTLFFRDTLRPFLKRMENLRFSGYMQPQFQVAQKSGAPSFEGGNFSEFSNNRFILRRARIKIDYYIPTKG